jgi:predicted ATP-grasp superfamily ATP-dependent carboligase
MTTNGSPERALVIGDDMRIFLAVVRSLGRAGKEVHALPFDWRAPALKSKYISKVHYLPRYSDDGPAWLSSLLHLLRTEAFDLIVPCCDRAILPLDIHRDELAGYRMAIPNREAMETLFDKERTRQLANELGIPVARGERLSGEEDAETLVGRYGLPLVIKPRRSYWIDRLDGWGKVWIPETLDEVEEVLRTVQDPTRYLVESFFKGGVGVGVSVLAQHGKILHAFQHRRMREGWGGSSSYRISEAINGQLLCACEKICERTLLTGVCMFEFRWNPADSSWILLETNARFWGSSPLPLSLGVDFPRFLFDLLVHAKQHPPVRYLAGIRSRNLVLDGFNLVNGSRRRGIRQLGSSLSECGDFLAQPLRWMTGQERSDSFVKDDLRPGFAECLALFSIIPRKFSRPPEDERNRRRSERAGAPIDSHRAAPETVVPSSVRTRTL